MRREHAPGIGQPAPRLPDRALRLRERVPREDDIGLLGPQVVLHLGRAPLEPVELAAV